MTSRVYNGSINKFYGLPKIHKSTLQLRPIISGINSPNRGVAQLVTDILTRFNNVIYKQTLGMPMGSPVSPILAQYVMDDLLENDIILTIPQGSTQTLLQVFNSYHPRLQFTIEEDDNHSVPFLDTKVIRKDDNKLITSWYTKPGASGRFLHYESYHEQRQKVNLVLGMKNRVLKTSHTTLKNDNLHKLSKKIHRQWVPKEVGSRLTLQ
ncbi:hypothetical protein NQ317_019682 [Molorchus minor]|uniref:Reverse transcriptase domain-containing protein n=1 Tax=Molorchus minor TaxID=1323400 RepID=A0ABQ9IRD1_9CUCU|nr:hypothetical protein NQ317_019682 [Molorchus minor]